MNMIVCAKQVPDPEIPPAKFRIDSKTKQIIPPEGIPPVINPFDERALELALRLKDTYGGTITVLTVGGAGSESVVKRGISMGATDGVVLSDPVFQDSDGFGIAHILTMAIKKIGNYDLILCGRQASDWDEGIVGSIIGENLNIPLVTLAMAIDAADGGLRVKRVTLDGYQIFSVPVPAVVTVCQEVGRPRLPSGSGVIMAARKKIPTWSAADINADPGQVGKDAATREITDLFRQQRERKCEIIQTETSAEAGEKLAEKLRDIGAL